MQFLQATIRRATKRSIHPPGRRCNTGGRKLSERLAGLWLPLRCLANRFAKFSHQLLRPDAFEGILVPSARRLRSQA